MRTLLFTGNGGQGIGLAAAATATAAARAGQRTLVVSIGPSHSLSTLFGTGNARTPVSITPNLSVWTLDVSHQVSVLWEQMRGRFGMKLAIGDDELPLVPGLDVLLGLEQLRQQQQRRDGVAAYDLLIVDAGPHDMLLRTLSLPDSFRWGVRLLFGLDRDPGRNSASPGQALVPLALLPFDWFDQLQAARVQLEDIRDSVLDGRTTTIRYVLRPDAVALEEARLAIPALQLHGLTVEALVAGPLLPDDMVDAQLVPLVQSQHAVTVAATEIWPLRPLLRLPWHADVAGTAALAALAALGTALYADHQPDMRYITVPAIEQCNNDAPFIAIDLPGLRREALRLTLSGDELIVSVGPYRRHILLPVALRGSSNIKASREGDRVLVRRR